MGTVSDGKAGLQLCSQQRLFLGAPAADNLCGLCRRICPDLGKPDYNWLTDVQGLS